MRLSSPLNTGIAYRQIVPSVVVGCLAMFAMAEQAVAQAPATMPTANVRLDVQPGREIPSNFLGLSHEWGNARRFLGSASMGKNAIYRQLLANLTAYGSGPMELRIGGNSTDSSQEPSPALIAPFAELARDTGAHFILGVNLAKGDPQLAVRQAQLYQAEMPPGSVEAYEIGNEPDLYYRNGRRTPDYSVRDYQAEVDQWRQSLVAAFPYRIKLAGPAWGSVDSLRGHLDDFEKRQQGYLAIFTVHYYQTNPGAHPDPDYFLQPRVATDGPNQVQDAVQRSHANRIPFRMGEFNSIGNQGVHGVSDDFATALWAVDTMFEYARVGVDGIDWEASDGNFDNPFYFSVNQGQRPNLFSLKYVSPLYYGLLFFQAATGNHARLLPAEVQTPENMNMKVWATLDASGTKRVVVLNKDKFRGGNVMIASGGGTHATVRRLVAPTPEATSNVTFAGQTFDGSLDGKPLGNLQVENINCAQHLCQIQVPAASAALVTLSR